MSSQPNYFEREADGNEAIEPLLRQQYNSTELPKKPTGIGTRHTFAILAFLGYVNVYALRVSLSVALVAMVKNNDSQSNANTSSSAGQCPVNQNSVKTSTNDNENGKFDWDEDLQGVILGSFFYGYIITQLPGGRLAEKFGGKNLFGYGILVTSIFTVITPPITNKLGAGALIILRILMGVGEGVTFPAMYCMLGKWSPRLERSILTTFINSGATIGTVLAMPVSGAICQSYLGWSSVFYILGGVSCLWVVVWLLFAYDTPADHPKISLEERIYIESAVGPKLNLPVPWKSIMTSKSVWALCIVSFSFAWGFYTMLTCLPTYISKVQKFDLSQDGFLSALPTIVGFPVGNLSALLADFLRNGRISTKNTRKLFTFCGTFFAAGALPFIQFAHCDHVVVIILLTVSGGIGAVAVSGFPVNPIDIACNFSGTVFGIINSFSTAAGMIAPFVVGFLTNGNNTIEQWQIVFYISSGLYITGGISYVILAEGSEQPWNRPVPSTHHVISINTSDLDTQEILVDENSRIVH